jgi:hypothetical protein
MKIVLIVFALSLAIGIGVLWNFGAFANVTVAEKTVPRLTIVYARHTGPYRKIRQVIDTVYMDLLAKEKIGAARAFGLYYDNPREAPGERLRSLGGCILDAPDEYRADSLRRKGYKVAVLPQSRAVYAEFPLKGQLSVLFGVFKTYPKMTNYLHEKKIPSRPFMEIYNPALKKIEYMMEYDVPMATYLEMLK